MFVYFTCHLPGDREHGMAHISAQHAKWHPGKRVENKNDKKGA